MVLREVLLQKGDILLKVIGVLLIPKIEVASDPDVIEAPLQVFTPRWSLPGDGLRLQVEKLLPLTLWSEKPAASYILLLN